MAGRDVFESVIAAVAPELLKVGYEIYEERACREVFDSCFVVFAREDYEGLVRLSWDGKEKLLLVESAPELERDFTAVMQLRFGDGAMAEEEVAAVVGEAMAAVEACVTR